MHVKNLFDKAQAIILDMDGVLVDTEPLHMEAFAQYLNDKHIHHDNAFLQSLIGYSIDDNIRRINQELLKGKSIPVEQGVEERDRIYIRLLKEANLKVMEGIRELVDICMAEHKKLALASSSSREQVDIILQALAENPDMPLDLRPLLSSVVTGDDVSNKKPAPDIYRQTVKNLNFPAGSCLAIEDSFAGIRSARAAGVRVLGLLNPYNDLRACTETDGLIQSLADLI